MRDGHGFLLSRTACCVLVSTRSSRWAAHNGAHNRSSLNEDNFFFAKLCSFYVAAAATTCDRLDLALHTPKPDTERLVQPLLGCTPSLGPEDPGIAIPCSGWLPHGLNPLLRESAYQLQAVGSLSSCGCCRSGNGSADHWPPQHQRSKRVLRSRPRRCQFGSAIFSAKGLSPPQLLATTAKKGVGFGDLAPASGDGPASSRANLAGLARITFDLLELTSSSCASNTRAMPIRRLSSSSGTAR